MQPSPQPPVRAGSALEIGPLQGRFSPTIWSRKQAPWYFPKGVENLHPHKYLHRDASSSCTYNYQNLEATKMFFSR